MLHCAEGAGDHNYAPLVPLHIEEFLLLWFGD